MDVDLARTKAAEARRELRASSGWRQFGDDPSTHVHKCDAALAATLAALTPTPPTPTPTPTPGSWSVAAPGSTGATVTTVHNAPTIGLNIQSNGGSYSDYSMDGSGDSMVLVGSGGRFAHGVTLRRFKMTNVAAANAVSWGKHGVYLDAYDCLLEDFDISGSSHTGSGISVRMGGTTIRRLKVRNCPQPLSFFDSDTGQTDGSCLVEDADLAFPGDTAIWCDAQDDFKTTFDMKLTFRNVSATGSGAFLKATRVRNGTFRFEGCLLNGKPLTSSDVPRGSTIL